MPLPPVPTGALSEKSPATALLDGLYPKLDALYKDIHQNPELGFQEKRTAGILAEQLRSLGFAVTEGVGGTGVVGVLENGPGPTVMVRTELDALPMRESTGLPYASTAQADWNGRSTYVAHSCGHDIHMACWTGAAQVLAAVRDRWKGRLMFLAQPSEELGEGAKAMMDDKLYERFGKPDYAFALHAVPQPIGVYWRSGAITSACDQFEITFHGKGGHGSNPSTTIDPVMMASRFVVDLQSVVSREKDPQQFGVVTVGAVEAGTAGNIIPDHAVVRGTIRDYEPAVRDKLVEGVRRTAKAVTAMAGAPEPDIAFEGHAESVRNDPELTERLGRLFAHEFQDRAIAEPEAVTASEDYSFFVTEGIRSCYFHLGVYEPNSASMPVNHDPAFAPVPEKSIRLGVQAMSLAVADVLA